MKASRLYDQNTFYRAFELDLRRAKYEVIIESPFVTSRRASVLLPVLTELRKRGITVIINTRNPIEHDGNYYCQALDALGTMQKIGIQILYTAGHHRKLAIIDRTILYEGSLNILSYSNSCEIMRRTVSSTEVKRLLKFIGLMRYVGRK